MQTRLAPTEFSFGSMNLGMSKTEPDAIASLRFAYFIGITFGVIQLEITLLC